VHDAAIAAERSTSVGPSAEVDTTLDTARAESTERIEIVELALT